MAVISVAETDVPRVLRVTTGQAALRNSGEQIWHERTEILKGIAWSDEKDYAELRLR
jgi:hypothetical protein